MTGRLIAFTGPAGAGKSTAAAALVNKGWHLVKFASPLKDMMRAFYRSCGIDNAAYIEARIEGDQKEEPDPFLRGRTPRHAMQTLGTEWGRDLIAPDFWVSAWQQRVGQLLASGADVVTDDCRFTNEANAVSWLGGTVVALKGRATAVESHVSEFGGIEADMTVKNDHCHTVFMRKIIYLFHETGPR